MAVALEPAEEPGEPGCLALVADHVGSRVSTDLGQQPWRHVAQRPEVQLQHGLVGECEPGGEPDDLEHDDGALERRGSVAGPGTADHGVREGRVRAKVGQGLEAVVARTSTELRKARVRVGERGEQ